MKKLIVIVVTLFIGTTAFCQDLDFGVKAGANFANISDASGLSNKTGFQAGLFAGVKFTDNLGVQADLLYSQQGAKFDAGDFDLSYINVPVVMKVYLVQGLNLQAGPQFGFIVNDNLPEVIGGDEDYNAEKTDVSGVVGAGYDFPFGVRLDARYNFGFSDVSKNFGGNNKNNVFSVALGYSFL